MAIHVALEFSVQPGKVDEFIGMMAEAFKVTRTKKGFIDIVAGQSNDDPDKLILWETWETEEDHEAYFNWRVETGFMEAIGPFMAGPPVKKIFKPVA